jgi:hypothetical protein
METDCDESGMNPGRRTCQKALAGRNLERGLYRHIIDGVIAAKASVFR